MDDKIRFYFAEIGAKGGKKSKRLLDPLDAKLMVKIREARKAYKNYYTRCFWSYDPNIQIGKDDLSWVAEKLEKYGDLHAWKLSKKICP